eukprot:scaffold1220_cov259-Pinguiococcus_pyrenoidosus.AAC.70
MPPGRALRGRQAVHARPCRPSSTADLPAPSLSRFVRPLGAQGKASLRPLGSVGSAGDFRGLPRLAAVANAAEGVAHVKPRASGFVSDGTREFLPRAGLATPVHRHPKPSCSADWAQLPTTGAPGCRVGFSLGGAIWLGRHVRPRFASDQIETRSGQSPQPICLRHLSRILGWRESGPQCR